jgi:DNA-binding transcriptional LysR family regulator
MQQILQRGAALTQHPDVASILETSWDDLHAFLLCNAHRSFRRASDASGVNSTTLMRKFDRLEQQLGTKLFVRIQTGLVLTDEGKHILKDVQAMERLSFDIYRRAAQSATAFTGSVRIAITEGPGTYWVMPRLIDFQKTHRQLVVDLRCAMEQADVARLEADIAVQFARPTNPDLIVSKIGRLHVYPFASREYEAEYGLPTSLSDWKDHRIVRQVAPQVDDTVYARVFGMDSFDGVTGMRLNSSSATLYAVERGAGIGLLPSCALALGADLVPVDVGVSHYMDFWLTYHADLKSSPKHMVVVDWLRRIFDPQTYPCFRDDFIHPNDLVPMMSDARDAYGLKGFVATQATRASAGEMPVQEFSPLGDEENDDGGRRAGHETHRQR